MNFGRILGDNLGAHFAPKLLNKDELQKPTNKFNPGIHPMHFLEILQHFHQNVPANNKKGLRKRNSPMCILSQNGYCDGVMPSDDDGHFPWKRCPLQRQARASGWKKKKRRRKMNAAAKFKSWALGLGRPGGGLPAGSKPFMRHPSLPAWHPHAILLHSNPWFVSQPLVQSTLAPCLHKLWHPVVHSEEPIQKSIGSRGPVHHNGVSASFRVDCEGKHAVMKQGYGPA